MKFRVQKHQIPRADLLFRKRMESTPFLQHPAFRYDFHICGYNDFAFGGRSGPDMYLSNFFHEMAHAIEFVLSGDSVEYRCQGGRYRFNVRTVDLGYDLVEELETVQCTEREIRTWAIELKFMHEVGFKREIEAFAQEAGRLSVWLSDYLNIDILHGTENQTERMAWVAERVKQHYSTLDRETIFNAFQTWLDRSYQVMQAQSKVA